ncbi:hypothetical protein GCM10009534_74830 [Kribbella sandramycini]
MVRGLALSVAVVTAVVSVPLPASAAYDANLKWNGHEMQIDRHPSSRVKAWVWFYNGRKGTTLRLELKHPNVNPSSKFVLGYRQAKAYEIIDHEVEWAQLCELNGATPIRCSGKI